MANKTCGGCQLYQGSKQKCGANKGPYVATNPGSSTCFKGPASLFNSKVCGGCRLYQGPSQKCGGGKGPYNATNPGSSTCYSPIPG
jgi:hypothetical protein